MEIKPNTAQATGVSIYLLPGQTADLYVPGYFAKKELVNVDMGDGVTEEVSLINGFRVLYPEVGTIEAIANKVAVTYTHIRAEANTVVFYARYPEGFVGFCNIISVPIHDHSTIVQGGPAFGTYFSDEAEGEAAAEGGSE